MRRTEISFSTTFLLYLLSKAFEWKDRLYYFALQWLLCCYAFNRTMQWHHLYCCTLPHKPFPSPEDALWTTLQSYFLFL